MKIREMIMKFKNIRIQQDPTQIINLETADYIEPRLEVVKFDFMRPKTKNTRKKIWPFDDYYSAMTVKISTKTNASFVDCFFADGWLPGGTADVHVRPCFGCNLDAGRDGPQPGC